MKKTLLLVFIMSSFISYAQESPTYKGMMNDYSINFYTVCQEAEKYFKTIDKEAKGSGYKQYMRWKVNNEHKFYPSGDRTTIDPEFVIKSYRSIKGQFSNQSNKMFYNDWKELGPHSIDSITGHYTAGLGRIEDMYIDPSNPNKIYLASKSGGFWKTTNGGANWTGGSTDFLAACGVHSIAVSPTNSDSILINIQNSSNNFSHGIYRSIDGGTTWTLSNYNPATVGRGGLGSDFFIYQIAYHPRVPNLVFVLTNYGIYRSDDNLQTWTIQQARTPQNDTHVKNIQFHPVSNDIIYTYNSGNQYRDSVFTSTDMGLSYSISAALVGNNTKNVTLSTSSDCNACVYAASDNGVWRSVDTGQTFTFLSNPSGGGYGFVVDDTDTSNMLYGSADIMRSTDGGQTFSQVTHWSLGNTNGAGNGHQQSFRTSTDYVHADLRKAKYLNGAYYAATDGLLCKSTDGGVNWTSLTNDLGIRENWFLGTSQSNHYRTMCGSQDNGTSIKLENTWIEYDGADGLEAIIHPLNDDWMIGSRQDGARLPTKNAGQSFQYIVPGGSAYWWAPMAYDPNNQMTVYDFRDQVYKSTDFGTSYAALGSPSTFSGTIGLAAIAENNSDIIVISKGSKIEKSTDGGITFNSIKNNLPNYMIVDIAFDPSDDHTIIVVYARHQNDNSKVYLTTDGGANWTNITHNLGNMPIRSVVIDHTPDRNIYLGAEIGVYTKPMVASNWTMFNTGLPNVAIRDMEINYGSNTIKAATWGRGLWEYSLVGRTDYPAIVHTTITDPPTEKLPKRTVDQYVSSRISYDHTLSSVYLEWSTGNPTFGNVINMSHVSDSTWVSDNPLPDVPVGTKVYFKVFAVGASGDTSVTYKFMYTVKSFAYCTAASGSYTSPHINNVTLDAINNNTNHTSYTHYQNTVPTLFVDSTYSISVSANTSWYENDYAAWIDYNGDGNFTASEQILLDPNSRSGTSASFTVPSDVILNKTLRMRVRLSYTGSSPSPCGSTTRGEVEDYSIRFAKKYCTATSGANTYASLYIDNVTLDAINNNTNYTLYTHYQNTVPTLFADSTYTISVSGNTSYGDNDYAAWIDYNGDKQFSPNEQILLHTTGGSSASVSFTVPSNVKLDDTLRMRVRHSYYGTSPSPCGTTNYGEVEDYSLLFDKKYCTASSSNINYLYIDNVTLDAINNNTGPDYYTHYQNTVPTLFAGSTYSISVSGGRSYSGNDYAAWIDYNGDKQFSPNEQILLHTTGGSSASDSFTVPIAVKLNDTLRMRVSHSYYNSPSPCGTFSFGEVEDYSLLFAESGSLRPLSLSLSVDAVQGKKQVALVSWETEMEKDILQYELLHSTNGVDFEPIYEVSDKAISVQNSYSYEHAANYGINYYKIRAKEFNNTIIYSEVKSIFFKPVGESLIIYPNPTKDKLYVELSGDKTHSYVLLNSIGQVVQKGEFNTGKNTIDLAGAPDGIYILKSDTRTFKIIKGREF